MCGKEYTPYRVAARSVAMGDWAFRALLALIRRTLYFARTHRRKERLLFLNNVVSELNLGC